jgi:hypothetical protein
MMIMNSELGRIGEEADMTYLKVPFWNFLE